MDEFFAARAATNNRTICIGPLWRSEAAEALDSELGDGTGYYLYLADASEGGKVNEVLGRLAGEDAARLVSDLLGFNALVPA